MTKEIIFTNGLGITQLHKVEINEEISLIKQTLEYCWNNLPFGFKPQYIG